MRRQFPNTLISSLTAAVLFLTACNMPASQTATPDANMIITEAAITAAAELTRTAGQNLLPTSTQILTVTATNEPPAATAEAPPAEPASPTATPAPTTAPASSGDAASFVADVTVPDDTYAAPGAEFLKTWRVKNTGTTTWTPAYGLVWIQGEKMGSPDSIPVPKEVRPGEEVEISVNLTAPTKPGTHQTYFRLRNAQGQYFRLDGSGDLWVKIIVGLPSTSTPTAGETPEIETTPTATETPTS